MSFLNVRWQWNIPNALSLLRLLLIPVFGVLYLAKQDAWAFGVWIFSGGTDMLDGMIARKCNQITECGKLLDPLADKLLTIAAMTVLGPTSTL